MQLRSVPILFSWPSRGGVSNYVYDVNSALGSRLLFGKVLSLLQYEAKVTTIHIIAHSMGNFIVLDALSALAQASSMPMISEVVMAAPDVDIDLFPSLIKNIGPFTRGMTLYASSNDKALMASRGVAKKPRAGDVFADGPLVIENVESIDVSAIGDELFGLNHN